MNFGGIEEPEYSAFDSSRVVVWPVSYEGTVSYGTEKPAGPNHWHSWSGSTKAR